MSNDAPSLPLYNPASRRLGGSGAAFRGAAMSKHTKGPWKIYSPAADEFAGLHFIWDNDGQTLLARTCFKPNSEANARLISAAPELLEALADCMKWLSAFAQSPGDRELIQQTDRFKRYKAAIAKAIGQ